VCAAFELIKSVKREILLITVHGRYRRAIGTVTESSGSRMEGKRKKGKRKKGNGRMGNQNEVGKKGNGKLGNLPAVA